MEFNKNQLEAINIVNGNVVLDSTAGSGKTACMVYRIKNLIENHNVSPSNILSITFSRKAKENLINRLDKLIPLYSNLVIVETFHSLALKIINSYHHGKYKVWTTAWEKEKVLLDICKRLCVCNTQDDLPYNEIMTFISKNKRLMKSYNSDDLYMNCINSLKEETVIEIFKQYEEYKQQNNLIEFDDFLNMAIDILNSDSKILNFYQDCFKYILVDEFQDTSLNQYTFISLLSKKNNNLFIVGDAKQAIYTFQMSDSKYMQEFDVNWNAKVIHLNMNYRCSKEIVDCSNEFSRNALPESKHRNYVDSIAFNGNYKKPEFRMFTDEKVESKFICNKINELVSKGYQYNDIAILARTNAQIIYTQTIMDKMKIPFDIVDGSYYTELPEVKLILSYLKLANNVYDNESFEYCYYQPNRWLRTNFLQETRDAMPHNNKSLYLTMDNIKRRNWKFKNGIEELQEVINTLQRNKFSNVGEMVHYLRTRLTIDNHVSKGKLDEDGTCQQIDNLNTFEFMCSSYSTIDELLNELNTPKPKTNNNYVSIMTLHKSKGLEFPVVFIMGVSDGLLPHRKAISENDINSEKRLLYVGITRAEKELYMSGIYYRNATALSISPFIKDLGDTIDIIKDNDSNDSFEN